MIDIAVHSLDGKQVDTLSIDEQKLGGEVRPALLKQAFVRYHANRRQGTSATRSRGLVEGSTRKLYRQKGTGNARRGAIRTNVMRGGGVAFGKKPKSWRQKMPTKMRRLANRNALLAKAIDNEIKLVDNLNFDKPSTKDFANLLNKLSIDRSCLLVLSDTNGFAARSARNHADIRITHVDRLNVMDVLNHRYLLADKQVLSDWIDKTADAASGNGRAVTDEAVVAAAEATVEGEE